MRASRISLPPAVLCIVVVPARDEQERVGDCLQALATQTLSRDRFEVILVADACADATVAVASAAARRGGIALSVLTGPGLGTGPARRLGMDAAMARLQSLGRGDGLIATTDADSRPAPDWLERQLAHVQAGAQVIAGLIRFSERESAALPAAVLERRAADAEERMRRVLAQDPRAQHHHFAGASLGITAGTYAAVGGLEATAALEDELFADRLAAHGVPVLRPDDVVASGPKASALTSAARIWTRASP
jgi:glucosyl-3-phosphoglycerate synthase